MGFETAHKMVNFINAITTDWSFFDKSRCSREFSRNHFIKDLNIFFS